MLKKSAYVMVSLALCAAVAPSQAAKSETGATAREGVIRCGGNHFLRLGGTEAHFTSYPLRNFDSANGITINRMRVFDAPGNVLFDSANSGLPTSEDGIIGPGNNVIGPNQSVLFDSHDLVPYLPVANRPIQLEIVWSAPVRVLTLDAVTVRIVRARNTAGGGLGEERSRHAIDCRSIVLR